MYKHLFSVVFIIALLTVTQFATADFLIANGSPTEPAWVIYSTWRAADANYPAGFRTQGWYKVEPGGFRNLPVPATNEFLYIRVERPHGVEVAPPDAATRSSYQFFRHPSQPFTVVQAADSTYLDSDVSRWSLDTAELYEYANGGQYTITAAECPVDMNLPVDQIYEQAMQSVVWIKNLDNDSQGSGVLIDEDRKLVVTNEHVTDGAGFVFVSFPVTGTDGELIGDREYYNTNWLSLALNGYGSRARVIAEDADRDLAILQLDFLPENSRSIRHDFTTDLSRSVSRNEVVHILGNPGGQNLWRWTLGLFKSDDETWVNINADVYGGNSGGPVLNGRGELIGIITLSNLRTLTWAVPARDIKTLLDTVAPRHTIRISNRYVLPIDYELKWSASDNWTQHRLDANRSITHWRTGATVATGYPYIRFNSDGVLLLGADKTYTINAFLRYFGDNYRDHVTQYDTYEYIFDYDVSTEEIVLSRGRNDGCVPLDVNGDGATDLKDLEYIVDRIGSLWPGNADVDNNGKVDISDVIFAAGLICDAAAAPSIYTNLPPTFTVENLQLWIGEAKQLDIQDPVFQKGIAVMESLLAHLQRLDTIPEETALLLNYPNPFNPETWIPYKLAKPAEVTVTIYAADGRVVRQLTLGHQQAGVYENKSHAAYWDGKNDVGESVASGVYFYTLKAGDFAATRKMLIRK